MYVRSAASGLFRFFTTSEMSYNVNYERWIMSLVAIARRLPQDLQLPMLEFAEAIEEDLRSRLAVRREDFEALQATVRELADSHRRAEQRLDRLEAVVAELAEAQKRTEQRVAELAEAQKRTEQRLDRLEAIVAELAEAQKRTEETLNKLIQRVDRIEVKLSGLVGDNLERKYRERAFSFLGQVLRPVHSVPLQDVLPQLEARLTEAEIDELLPLDVLLRGQVRQLPTRPEIWLAMEVSAVVDQGDVNRAVSRARLLTKAGLRALPAVAGEEVTEGARLLALRQKVVVLQDGQRANWSEALEQAFSSEES